MNGFVYHNCKKIYWHINKLKLFTACVHVGLLLAKLASYRNVC